jgi:hypothetical protein
MLEQLDPGARRELDALVQLRRDGAESCEFHSKGRSVRLPATRHIAGNARRPHS